MRGREGDEGERRGEERADRTFAKKRCFGGSYASARKPVRYEHHDARGVDRLDGDA